jgi:uncharacterized membrane protein
MPRYLLIGLTAIILLVIDLVYLSLTSQLWRRVIIATQGSDLRIDWLAGLAVYLVMAGGLYYFIFREHRSVMEATLLGWLVYLVFDLTNKALLSGWSWTVTMLDGAYGGVLFALCTWLLRRAKLV